MTGGAFFLALFVGWGSQNLLTNLTSILLSFLLLLVIILVGVLFDILGVAAAAADEAPLHARAARKQRGARQALQLVRHADQVSSICSDVVGDVSATMSGAVGAAIVIRLATRGFPMSEVTLSTLMTAVISALIIGGKALFKGLAISQAEWIVWRVGVFLDFLEKNLGFRLWSENNKNRSKKKGRKT